MTNSESKELCLALLRADSESEVVSLLKGAGFWDDKKSWRLYGDKEGNWAQAGNQQSLGEAALVEKIVNSVDARLMSECLKRGINPESPEAPDSIRDAIAMFFEGGRRSSDDQAGTISQWASAKRTEESREITLAATGAKPTRGRKRQYMSITVADRGEGQSPNRLHRTILSLNEKNKQSIRFVQGKFNMGGTGTLRFCGQLGLQLVITRRNRDLADRERAADPSVDAWSFTLVRREKPTRVAGEPVHSEYTYLAPVGADDSPRKGSVLQFDADTLPLMPVHDEAYAREVDAATVIKLYEYETTVGQSHITRPDGLLYALERLLPEIALPIRLHECRGGYKGVKERSFETPLAGLVIRLEDGRGDNLEDDFPLTVQLRPEGMPMTARIYAFKEDKASTYLKDEGVIFVINGQAHGYLPKSLFSRPKAVGLPRLRDSLLMVVDCSNLDVVQREDLFMTSRDRLSKKPIRFRVEEEIEDLLKHNAVLRKLQQSRKEQDVEQKLSEEKPLEEVLGKVLKASPTLNALFLRGRRLARPFAGPGKNGPGSGPGPDEPEVKNEFKGRRHPTYFRIANHEYGKAFFRNCELGRRCRIKFETDVENGYFDRGTDQGRFELEIIDSEIELSTTSYSLGLEGGFASLSLALPAELQVGDKVTIQASVFDSTLQDPFVNVVELTLEEKKEHPPGPKSPRQKRPGQGTGGPGVNDQGIALPNIIPVRENDSHWDKHKFVPETACHVISDPIEVDGRTELDHTFYINMDNISLKTEMKYAKNNSRLLEAKYKYGNVLIGLALLHDDSKKGNGNGHAARASASEGAESEEVEETVQDRIRVVTGAVAPVLIPMIDQLGGLDEDELASFSEIGDDE
jgi:hypothetical protein